MISGNDILSILPMVILAGGSLITMLLVAMKRNHELTFLFAMGVLACAFAAIFIVVPHLPHSIGDLFLMDYFGLFYQALILLAAMTVTVFSYFSIRNFFPGKRKEEYYLLLMFATLGAGMMVISTHFISFFVSLEILSVSLYSLIGYYRERTKPIEAGVKYLIIAAMSSAFLLFGMALIYAITGNMAFQNLSESFATLNKTASLMAVAGWGMMIVGIGFKLAVVPFHMWTPDVYEGASSPVSAFIASISKGAMVAVLIRIFVLADLYHFDNIIQVFTAISILSMLIGNLLALLQKNIKRLLAYSSIAHFGYALVALISGAAIGPQAATFYVTTYFVAILAAFGLVTLISQTDKEAVKMKDYRGLFWRKPFLAAIFTIVLLSLAGIPLTAGFMGKYFLLTAGVGSAEWALVFVLVISSVIGLFYYLRLIGVMMKKKKGKVAEARTSLVFSGVFVLAVLGALIVWIGVYPTWLMELVNNFFTV